MLTIGVDPWFQDYTVCSGSESIHFDNYHHCSLDLKRFIFSWFPASMVTIGINPLLQVTTYFSGCESFHLAMSPSLVLTIWIFVVCLERIRFTNNDCTSHLLEFILPISLKNEVSLSRNRIVQGFETGCFLCTSRIHHKLYPLGFSELYFGIILV